MINTLEIPLVADYLRELDAALAGLPAAVAAELSEQIRAHLLEALPPDADKDAVTAVLAALGPASLVAATAATPASSRRETRLGVPLRRVVTWARRLPVKVRLAVAAIAIATGLLSGALIFGKPRRTWNSGQPPPGGAGCMVLMRCRPRRLERASPPCRFGQARSRALS